MMTKDQNGDNDNDDYEDDDDSNDYGDDGVILHQKINYQVFEIIDTESSIVFKKKNCTKQLTAYL